MERTRYNATDKNNDTANYNISTYVSRAKKIPLLTKETEVELATKARAGDKTAANKLIEANLLLVVKIAHEYKSIFNNINDLIQEGNLGLIRSVSTFDPSRGNRFSTYAGWWIKSLMMRYIFNNSHMIKPGTTNEHKRLFYNLRKEQRRLGDLGIKPDAATIAQNLDVSEEDVVEMDVRLKNDVYLDDQMLYAYADDEASISLMDCMMTPVNEQPDVVYENADYNDMIKGKLDTFAKKLKNDRQRMIFYERIIADEPKTLTEIGDKYKISRERTRQIQEDILIKLKKYLGNIIEA